MQPNTRNVWNGYLNAYANHIGNPGAARNEAAHYPPAVHQKSFRRVAERAEFLKEVNHVPVDAQIGQRIGIGKRVTV